VTVRAVSGIATYCFTECTSLPQSDDITFPNGAAAEAAGYIACTKCRPRLCGEAFIISDAPPSVLTALTLIKEGFLHSQSEEMLAIRVGSSRAELRRLMLHHLGATPTRIAHYRQIHFARQLITETSLDTQSVARAAGLTGRQHLDQLAFKTWGHPICDLKPNRASRSSNAPIKLLLKYVRPYSFKQLLQHLRSRVTPGIEEVTNSGSYRRVVSHEGNARIIEVSDAHDEQHLAVQVHSVSYDNLIDDIERLRTLLAIDEDPAPIVSHLLNDHLVGASVAQHPWLRVPRCWDPFETSVRIIIGQQISVAAATTITGRIAHKLGEQLSVGGTLDRVFPNAATLAKANLKGLGLTDKRATTLEHFAKAVANGNLDLRLNGAIEEVVSRWSALPGIGPWTAHMAAMRVLQHNDAMPSSDLGIRRTASKLAGNSISSKELDNRSLPWRPFRSWAVQHLWEQ
jgi:AraC family transcriptional regulator of adaptative response / DNA-3-methyladenine glycosylase II|tara:strand:+ start:1413 stop:2783 length:1371 start_codon:yes stop_codon:yes gene_type:complete